MITKEQVVQAQNEWAKGVIEIGSIKDNSACKKCANDFLKTLFILAITNEVLQLVFQRR